MSTAKNWVRESAAAPGVGDVSLGGVIAVTDATFLQAYGSVDTDVYYSIEDGTGNAEAGEGRFLFAANVLQRTTPKSTLTGGVYNDTSPTALNFVAAVTVSCTVNARVFNEEVVFTTDPRLSDSRTPTAHAASHGTGQSDELAPAAIGAATSAQGALADSALQAVSSDATLTGDGTSGDVLGMADTGVVAGAYTSADITVDSMGRVTVAANGTGGGGTDPNAIHVDTANEISGIAPKATPVSADILVIEDSAAGFAKKKVAVSDLPGGTPDLANAVFPDSAHFASQVAADATVAFTDGNKQSVNATTNPFLTLSAPGVGSYILQILNSGSIASISPTPLWDSGTAPAWNGTSILALYYDGTDWYGSAIVSAS